MKKSTGFYTSVLAALLGIVSLVLMFMYRAQGGAVDNTAVIAMIAAILLEAASFFGEKPWTDFTAVGGAAALSYGMMKVLGDGLWNIAESINGIKMVGLPELAGMNYAMADLQMAAILLALIACFSRKSKE